ncbi:hypothetical protein Q7P37_010401 [Cladosporium fusiforme]
MSTFTNCLVLPYIAYGLNDGFIADPDGLAQKYNILRSNDKEFPYTSKGYPIIWDCLLAECTDSTHPCNRPLYFDIDPTCYMSNGTSCGPPQFSINLCERSDHRLNADIGGKGVIVSYIMQSLILLAAYLIQSASTSWIKWASLPLYAAKARSGRWIEYTEVAEAYEKASNLQRRLAKQYRLDRHAASLVAALVDFQKTQVFFLLTVEIAVIVALFDTAYLYASSWDQLWTNVAFIHAVGFNATDAIVFGVVLLRKGGKASWYISVASVCCVIVSSITVFRSFGIHYEPYQLTTSEGVYKECYWHDPHAYCLGDHQSFGPGSKLSTSTVVSWAVSPIIMLVILVEKLGSSRRRLGLSRTRRTFGRANNWLLSLVGQKFTEAFVCFCKPVVSMFAEIWLVWRLCYAIAYYVGQLPNAVGSENDDGLKVRWALGQIIAVAVWIPVIIEYIYLLIHGIEKGSLYRLVRPYHVSSFPPGSPANASVQSMALAAIPTAQQPASPSPASSTANVNTQSIPPGTPSVAHQVSTGSLAGSVQEPLLRPQTASQLPHASTWSPA